MSPKDDPLCPFPAVVCSIEPEAPGVWTFRVGFADHDWQARYRVAPGQFNMLYLSGIGEMAVSDGPDEGPAIGHTIRFVGRVTREEDAIRDIRKRCRMLICLGACASHGGIQGLMNFGTPLRS